MSKLLKVKPVNIKILYYVIMSEEVKEYCQQRMYTCKIIKLKMRNKSRYNSKKSIFKSQYLKATMI